MAFDWVDVRLTIKCQPFFLFKDGVDHRLREALFFNVHFLKGKMSCDFPMGDL